MNSAEIIKAIDRLEKVVHENNNELMSRLDKLEKRLSRIERMQEVIRIVLKGEVACEYPWFTLPAVKMEQVRRVFAYLGEHRSATVRQAILRTFEPTVGGYENIASLRAYCYRVHVDKYV